MNISTWLVLATLGGALVAGSACSQKAADETTNGIATTVNKVNADGNRVLDATKEGAAAVINETRQAGEAITDGWITTKVSATFVGETLLRGSAINVDTDNHVVTLKGTVGSDAAKARAATIARGTEGVTRVVNQLVVT